MNTYCFTVTLAEVDRLTDEMAEALFAAGCDDGTPSSRDGVVRVAFDRDAESLEAAVRTAIRDVLHADQRVATVELDAEWIAAVASTI